MAEPSVESVDWRIPASPVIHGSDAHAFRTSWLAQRLARLITLDEKEIFVVATAARLHDIGKCALPPALLEEPRSLSGSQRRVIQTHPELGARLLKTISYNLGNSLVGSLNAAMFHHERWDGQGYPCRLSGLGIPRVARLISVVDVFDALVTARPYKEAWQPDRALDYIRQNAGTQFDPAFAEAFASSADQLPRDWIDLALRERADSPMQDLEGRS